MYVVFVYLKIVFLIAKFKIIEGKNPRKASSFILSIFTAYISNFLNININQTKTIMSPSSEAVWNQTQNITTNIAQFEEKNEMKRTTKSLEYTKYMSIVKFSHYSFLRTYRRQTFRNIQ